MANYNYGKFKIQVDPQSAKTQGLKVGDVVRRQYHSGNKVIYSLMVVIETGEDIVDEQKSPWFIGGLLEGDAPEQGELLDFVRVTNLFDTDRSGAMYFTAFDSDSPYMDVIDGMSVDNSLCYPTTVGTEDEYGDPSKYTPTGDWRISKSIYKEEEDGVSRIHRISRAGTQNNPYRTIGFLQRLANCPASPERIIISFKIRAERKLDKVPVTFGITSTGQIDASWIINIGTEWSYNVFVLTLSYPSHYERDLIINLTEHLNTAVWCEMAELNILRLSDISVFAAATKSRVGKISGIVDPVFGTLEGYGAYFQHLYATKNVNIAGTLTAGDENGFASTFYVGKIHKNVIVDSTVGKFADPHTCGAPGIVSPIGIGKVWKLGAYCLLQAQSSSWRTSHLGKRYCFSFWALTDEPVVLSIYQDEHHISNIILSPSYGWRRHYLSFTVKDSENSDMAIRLDCTTPGTLLTAPQLEAGTQPSQYQPTDGKLSYVEDYGAWFSKGGIGGTIQNPLLRLETDGSIRSHDDAFVINPDGTGHFGSGRFSFTKDTIILKDYLIRWEDLDEEAREKMKGEQGEKGDTGASGSDGLDANLLDWVKEWDSGKTIIDSQTVLTPKIFAGVVNETGTISGIALGQFGLKTRQLNGEFVMETINGLYGFWEGMKTFGIDSNGNVQIGYGDQVIKYDIASGKIIFGSQVAMAWIGATFIDKNGIFTGTLSANTVNAIQINAAQITAGIISADRIDVASLKSQLITAGNIEALTLNVVRGKIGGWSLDANSIYKGTKNDNAGAFTAASGSITIGANGIRGFKWNLESTGAGKLAGGNIVWDDAGNVTFGASVSLQWKNDIESAKSENFGYPFYKKIVIYGDLDKYYPVVIKGGDQTVLRDILVKRQYSEQAPTEWNTATHKGGLTLLIRANFGGWGGVQYYWNIYELAESYTRMFAGAARVGNSTMFSIFLRGGGTTGAAYHLYSDQQLDDPKYSPENEVSQEAPQICYNSDLIFVSGENRAYAPAPRTLTTAVEEEIRKKRFIQLSETSDTYLGQHPLTYIGSTGIYTGTLTAVQVNAVSIDAGSIKTGTLSADRIAAGSIKADKLDAASIKTSIINTEYINGLTLNFVRGKIGGWTIAADTINAGSFAVGNTFMQLRTAASGSGYVYTGAYKPMGLTLSWYQPSNAGHLVFGSINATGNTQRSGFVGLQMMSYDHQEFFCISANVSKSGGKEIYNRIAGWAFDHQTISKGNVSLGADGTIGNGTKWKLANDGSGLIASGNISWDIAGNVTFASSIKLQWQKDIDAALKDVDIDLEPARELALAMAYGKMLYRDPTFYNGVNNLKVYNNSGNGTVTHTRAVDSTAPNDSGYVILIRNTGTASPGCGGFYFGTPTSYRKVYITRIIANIPVGRNISFGTNSYGTGGRNKWLTPVAGTGDWCEYILKVVCGISGAFNSTNHFSITGEVGTTAAPMEWKVAYATVFDTTSAEKLTTTIDANGIYTGTLTASQINAVAIDAASIKTGLLAVERLAAGSITASKLNISDVRAAVVTADHINGLTLNFSKGKIGGWTIGADNITSATYDTGQAPIHIRTTTSGSGTVYTGSLKPYGITLTWRQTSNAGHLVLGQVMTNGSAIRPGYMGLQMMNHNGQEFFCMSVNTSLSGSTAYYNRIAGWEFTNQAISKGNVSLGADGSITNGTKWKFNNDGSGSVAAGNISWTAAGAVTFSSAVTAQWQTGIDAATDIARAMSYGKMLFRYPEFSYNGAIHYNGTGIYCGGNATRGIVTVVGCPNSTGYALRFIATGWHTETDKRIAGPSFANSTRANAIYIVRIIAQIPIGFNINNYHNSYGGGTQKWLTSQAGTGKWEEYICKVSCGASGTFSTINHLALTGGSDPTASAPVTWYIAYATVFDITSAEGYLTTITADGLYTGKIGAAQINVDSTLVVGGSTYNGSISVRNASNTVMAILDRTGITATGGKIAGWTIDADSIYRGTKMNTSGNFTNASGSVTLGSNGIRGYKWNLDANGTGRLAGGNISWTTTGALTVTGTVNATSGQIGGFTVASGRIGSIASGTSSSGGELAIYRDLIRVGTATSYTLLGGNTMPATVGGHTATARFTNTTSNKSWFLNNYGVYADVKNGYKNFGLWTNAAILGTACLGIGSTYTGFTGNGYTWDFSQCNLFYVWANAYISVVLPTESQVRQMFGYSSLPSGFAFIFTIVYEYNWANKIRVDNVINNNGDKKNVDMAKGDVLTLMCTTHRGFHYQIINHHA